MGDLALQPQSAAFDFSMLLDADTAINVTNVGLFAQAIPGGSERMIYTGRCQQEGLRGRDLDPVYAWHATQVARSRNLDRYMRQDVAQFIEWRKRNGSGGPWPLTIPPSPGGGPGLLFSRAMLAAVRPKLDSCKHMAGWNGMGDTIFSGGDSMLTRCFASLGWRCSSEKDLRIDESGRCPFAHGCALAALFRKNPPWFYVAAGSRRQRERGAANPIKFSADVAPGTPLEEAVAFHHVKPTTRSSDLKPDPRCGVRMRSDPSARAGWWASSCLPHFCLAGAPHAGADALLHLLHTHPEVAAATFEDLDFFSARGRFANSFALTRSRRLKLYANQFPSIDPRDYRITGDASPKYLYQAAATAFFAQPNMRLHKVVVVLREPVARTLQELTASKASPQAAVEAARALLKHCTMSTLYALAVGPGKGMARASPATTSCSMGIPALANSSRVWRAITRSWYHLYLQRWMATRPLVLFSEVLRERETASRALSQLATFLRLHPAKLDVGKWQHELSSRAAPPQPQLLAAEERDPLRQLMADTVARTDAMLRAAGYKARVPAAWTQGK